MAYSHEQGYWASYAGNLNFFGSVHPQRYKICEFVLKIKNTIKVFQLLHELLYVMLKSIFIDLQ